MRQTTIHQPAPCHEDWEAMSPTNVGRHCATCQTQVVDFTRMTDGEVVTFLRQYSPVRRCGRFRDDQVGRQLLAAARPVAGWRRWAGAALLLLGSVVGLKARAQGTKPGPNARAMRPAATSTTYASTPDSLFLVRGVVRNRWGFRQAGVRVTMRGCIDSTDVRGRFQVLVPKQRLGTIRYINIRYYKPRYGRNYVGGRVRFDSARTEPYHIRMHKVINRNPGFF